MTSPSWTTLLTTACTLIVGILLRFLYRRIRPWIRTREERANAKDKAMPRPETASYFSAFVIACAVAFALLVLQAATLPESPATPIVRILAGGSGALGLFGALLLVFGVPAYNHVQGLDNRVSQSLAEQNQRLDHLNHLLENRCQSLQIHNLKLQARHQELEERLKAVESQSPAQKGLLQEHLPVQRNLAFMELWSVPKRDQDTDLIKRGQPEVGRFAGSSQR